MRWLVRFLVWATILAIPCFLVMKGYQATLAEASMRVLASLGFPIRLELRLQEPFNLGIYAAMCLASVRAPMRERVRALAIGLPALSLFGLCTVVTVIGSHRLLSGDYGAGASEAAGRLVLSTIETIPWISAPALWLTLLGARELPNRLLH